MNANTFNRVVHDEFDRERNQYLFRLRDDAPKIARNIIIEKDRDPCFRVDEMSCLAVAEWLCTSYIGKVVFGPTLQREAAELLAYLRRYESADAIDALRHQMQSLERQALEISRRHLAVASRLHMMDPSEPLELLHDAGIEIFTADDVADLVIDYTDYKLLGRMLCVRHRDGEWIEEGPVDDVTAVQRRIDDWKARKHPWSTP